MANSMLLSPGDKFEKYIIEKELGHGGMGAVYLVRHSILDSKYALKVLYPEVAGRDKQFVERFIREGRLAGQIRHENLIAVYDAGQNEKNGMYYLVMDFVAGGSVRDRIKKNGYIDMLDAISIVRQVACALQAAQNHNMVHRDIKPDNIMFDDKGVVRLADLGIAKATDDRDTGLTMESSVFGTPAYMSPEQARDSSKVDTRADIYSLGVVFFEMLTGRRPFSGETTIEILSKVIDNTPAPDVRTYSKDLPPDVAQLVSDMLEKDRDKRVSSPTELIKRIDALDLSAYQAGTQAPAEEVEVTMPTMASPIAAPSATVATLATAVDAKSAPKGAEPPALREDAPAPSGAEVTMPTMAQPIAQGASPAPSGLHGDAPAPSGADMTMPTMAQPIAQSASPAPSGSHGEAPAPSGADMPQPTMAMDGPSQQGNAAPAAPQKGGKGGLMLILALVGVAAFVVIGGVGTVLFLKRDAIMAKFKKPGVVQNGGTETEPTNVSPQPPAPAPEVVKPNPPAPKPVEPPKPVVKPVEPPKPPVATVPKETVPNRPADVKPATPPKQENVEFGLADQTEKPNAKAPQTEATKPVQQPAQQVTQPVQQVTQPAQQPAQPVQQVTQPVVQQGQNGLMRLGSFEDGGVVLFGANDGRNTSFFRELSKNETFKAVGFQEASKNVQQWCDQLGEIQGNGPAFVIVSISVNRNDFQFKKMMQGLIKTLPSNNAVVLLATSNEDVMDEVRQNCDTVGMFYRKWGSNKELVTYIVDLKKELGW